MLYTDIAEKCFFQRISLGSSFVYTLDIGITLMKLLITLNQEKLYRKGEQIKII